MADRIGKAYLMDEKVKVGVIGCGNISPAYFNGCRGFDVLEIAACADIDMARAKARAQEFSIPRACTVDELLADDEIRIVLNLTLPRTHAELNLAAVEVGKSAYCEKPFAVTRQEGQRVLDAARNNGVRPSWSRASRSAPLSIRAWQTSSAPATAAR